MSETPFGSEPVEPGMPPIDLGDLSFTDVPPSDDFAVPQAEASKDERTRRLFGPRKPREAPTRTRAPRKTPVPKTRPGALVEPIEQIYTTIGALWSPFDPVCGGAVIASAHNCAQTLDDLAQRNDAVRRALLALTQTSAIGAVAVAHAPIALAVATHHVPAVAAMQADMTARMAERMEEAAFRQRQAEQSNGEPEA